MASGNLSSPEEIITQQLRDSAEIKIGLLNQTENILRVAEVWASALAQGNKVMFCGNGGSAADSQHLAAELVGRLSRDRDALSALALTVDTSILTAVANDFSFDQIFARQVAGHGRAGDVLVGISTSGESRNVVAAFLEARKRGVTLVAFTGLAGQLKDMAEYSIRVPSTITPRIQEGHITVGHIICEIVEGLLYGND